MKIFINLILVLMVFSVQTVAADGLRYTVVFEAKNLNIKLSNDRTGIIKNVVCAECDFNLAIITPATRAFVKGEEVDLLNARSRANKPATAIIYLDTREVRKITWVE